MPGRLRVKPQIGVLVIERIDVPMTRGGPGRSTPAIGQPPPTPALGAPTGGGAGAVPMSIPGQGGPYLPLESPSLEQLRTMADVVNESAERTADIFTLVESRLFEARMRNLLIPSTRPVDGQVGSGFGFRRDPFTGRPALHAGLDFPADVGTPIVAAAGGVVSVVQDHPAYGKMVEVDHGNQEGAAEEAEPEVGAHWGFDRVKGFDLQVHVRLQFSE